jgi:acyl dehydratase
MIDELPSLSGRNLGMSGTVEVPQERIDAFADATEDRQWIHLNPALARTGPFGGTIAHGYLTLSLSTILLSHLLEVTDAAQVVNYGLNRVRFPAPVPAGAALKMMVDVVAVDEFNDGYQMTYRGTAFIDGQAKPVCVMDGIFRYYRRTAP